MNAPIARKPVKAPRVRRAKGAIVLPPSLERRRVQLYLAMLLIDTALIFAAFFVAGRLYLDFRPERISMLEAQLLLPLYLTTALQQRAYSMDALERWRFAAGRALFAMVLAATLLIFVTFYAKITVMFSRVVFTAGLFGSALLIAGSRRLIAAWIARTWGPSVTNILLIEAGGPDVPLRHATRVSAAEHGIEPDSGDPQALDRLGQYLLNMDRVVVSCPIEDRLPWAVALRAAGVRGELVSDRLSEVSPIGLRVEEGWHALVVSTGPLGMQQRVIKRAFDTALSLAALVALSPVLLVTALAIWLEDRGPVLFVQQRMGRGNRLFQMFKFRSMRVESSDASGGRSASPDDDRPTRVGRFIRRTSIDELPQLINVLLGEMSLVGPRPHALGSHAGSKLFWDVDRAYWHRHALKPGLTGLAQIRGHRGATDEELHLTQRLASDLEYISDWSLKKDVVILLQTLQVIVHPRAY